MRHTEGIDDRYLVLTRPFEKVKPLPITSCFKIINCPITRLEENKFDDTTIKDMEEFKPDLIVLTSEFGAKIYFDKYQRHFIGLNLEYIAIGKATSRIVENNHHKVMLPDTFDSKGILKLILKNVDKGKRIALFRSSYANRIIDDFLTEYGYIFRNFEIYRVEKKVDNNIMELLSSENCFGLILTSSMEAEILFEQLKEKNRLDILRGLKIFSIGNVTSRRLKSLEIEESEPKGQSDIIRLINEISEKYCKK